MEYSELDAQPKIEWRIFKLNSDLQNLRKDIFRQKINYEIDTDASFSCKAKLMRVINLGIKGSL